MLTKMRTSAGSVSGEAILRPFQWRVPMNRRERREKSLRDAELGVSLMTDNKLVGGPILSFVGGFVIFIVGALELSAGETAAASTPTGFPVSVVSGALIDAGVVGIVCGLIIVALAILAGLYSDFHGVLGGFVILFSLISLASGIGVGFLLAVLGGTGCIVFGPEENFPHYALALGTRPMSTGVAPTAAPPQVSTPPPVADKNGRTLRGCGSCGTANPIDATICSSCGKPL